MTDATARAQDRLAARDALLAAHGWTPAHAAPLAGDASARTYLRLADGRRRAVLMDADPAAGEDVRPFLASTGALRARGLSAPEILGADEGAGFLLLEDQGDDLFARVCAARPEAEPDLYAAAVDLLARMHAESPPTAAETAAFAPYDMDVLLREARLVTQFYLPAATGEATPAAQADAYDALCEAAFAPAAEGEAALVLRDYHAENLIWLPERSGAARVGLLDHQDMLVGRPAYDLVSLLEDARRDTGAVLREAMLARYMDARGFDPAAREAFRRDYALLGAQRNLKIVGIFARLCLRDGKPRYLSLIPRVWAHLAHDLSHPALAPLAAWAASELPPPSPGALDRIAARAGQGAPA